MLRREKATELSNLLQTFPVVALLGPRQVGKTTLAFQLANQQQSIYLDLESEVDRAKLLNPTIYLGEKAGILVILDEIHRMPNLFNELRGIVDANIRAGNKFGQFLLLGSASMELLKQSSESLAGRIAYCELTPLTVSEYQTHIDILWLRGGFPDSVLATSAAASLLWRKNFIRTYLERDIPMLGPRIPTETLRRFWTMLAHQQGGIFNASVLASGLGVSVKTVQSYLDLLVDLLLVRRLEPYAKNIGKRLIKSPKIYVRDSGLLHALLNIPDKETLMGHPIIGASWEGFMIENLLNECDHQLQHACFYRTSSHNEVDLIIEKGSETWCIEVKRSLAPKLSRGFNQAIEDIQPQKSFILYPGQERYPMSENVEVIGIVDLLKELKT